MQFTVRMPDQYGKKLAILAEKMGLKRSDIARLALKQFVEENFDETVFLMKLKKDAQRLETLCSP